MPEIAVTLDDDGGAYVALVVGDPPEVRESVALDALEVLDFDFYGRLIGLRVTGSADSVLAPSLLDAAG